MTSEYYCKKCKHVHYAGTYNSETNPGFSSHWRYRGDPPKKFKQRY